MTEILSIKNFFWIKGCYQESEKASHSCNVFLGQSSKAKKKKKKEKTKERKKEKLILKVTWDLKGPQTSKTILKKKNKVGELIHPDF